MLKKNKNHVQVFEQNRQHKKAVSTKTITDKLLKTQNRVHTLHKEIDNAITSVCIQARLCVPTVSSSLFTLGFLGLLVFIVTFLFDKYLSRCFWTLSRRTLVVHSNCFLMYSPHRVSISWCLSLHSSLISNTLFLDPVQTE